MTKEKLCSYLFLLVYVVLLNACITPFSFKNTENEDEILVVDGNIILNGETKVYLSLMEKLDDNYPRTIYIKDANVLVESKLGIKLAGTVTTEVNNPPFFLINTRMLPMDGQYKLCIDLPNGRSYESDFLTPLLTPEIDAIDYAVNETGSAVDFLVTTYGNLNSSYYYKWNYTEDWEVTAQFRPNIYYNPQIGSFFSYPSDPLLYYCWGHSASTSILITRTDHLAENTVHKFSVVTIGDRSDKISYLYSIELVQMSISGEAYTYWSTLKRNTDEIGGIFAPQPNDLYGNIRCVSDKKVRTIGYISAGTRSVKRIFASFQDIGIYKPFNCSFYDFSKDPPPPPTDAQLHHWGYRVVQLTPREWAPARCVDCTMIGTKNKPYFWPNDHQ